MREFATAVALSSLALGAAPSPLAARETLVLEPSSRWAINYAADSCRLARTFGQGDDKVVLYLERYDVDPTFQLVVAGTPLAPMRNSAVVWYQFGPEEARQKSEMTPGTLGEFDPSLLISQATLAGKKSADPDATTQAMDTFDIFGSPELTPAEERATTWFAIGKRKKNLVRLDLGPMDQPMNAMRKCTEELLTHWGIDIEKHRHLTRAARPIGNYNLWIKPSDYPTEMLEHDKQGLVQFRIMVGPDGNPTSCHIQQSTRPKEFDDAVCASMMRKAKFRPALDANGKPLASFWRNAVRFIIPDAY